MGKTDRSIKVTSSAEFTEKGFDDILGIAVNCRFADCTHETEPGCVVKIAVADGRIPDEHFRNYIRQKKEAEHISEKKNKTKAIDYMKQRKLFQGE